MGGLTSASTAMTRTWSSAEQLFDVHRKILARKPLLIWGDLPEQDLDWIFSNLPAQGLAVVVTSPEHAKALCKRYVG